MIRQLALLITFCALTACGGAAENQQPPAPVNKVRQAAPVPRPLGDTVRIRMETALGAIILELDHRRAPITTANFVRYIEERRFDGAVFYRASRTRGAPERGFIQGGARRSYQRLHPPIEHEPTSETGLRHVAGAISMAMMEPGRATTEFVILATAMPHMDARRGDPGFAAFGRVVEGMDVVRRILAAETMPNVGSEAMRGQMIRQPVPIVRVTRID